MKFSILRMALSMIKFKYLFSFFLIFISSNSCLASDKFITLQSTTSIRDSGLYNYLFPFFEEEFKIKIRLVAVGTGQALSNIKNCDGDLAITHAPNLENLYLDEGYISKRIEFMYNDFVFVGPESDPLNISSSNDPSEVLNNIYFNKAKFISRGDSSGTHISELNLWSQTDLSPEMHKNTWYMEVGQGMGATLNIAIGSNAYTYTDRSTWINFKNKSKHKILYSNHKLLKNQYSLLLANSSRCPKTKVYLSNIFKEWLLSDKVKLLIKSYAVKNQFLFYIN